MQTNEDENPKNDIANIYDLFRIIFPCSKNVIEFHKSTDYLLILVGILAGIESLYLQNFF
ncbi:MAG: hypothetical protein K2X69_15020 [Silvanigrellaceae bacterium]|jgi:hypothetical protein|nr:hypothetical protein [Silvanigrellaceae bacterium]